MNLKKISCRYSSKHPLKGVAAIENRHLPMAISEITELKHDFGFLLELSLSVSLSTPFSILTTRVNVGYFPFIDASKNVLPNCFNDRFRAAEFSCILEM